MIGEGWIIKDLEGNGPGLIDMLFRLLLGESEENQDTPWMTGVPAGIQTEDFPNKALQCYRCPCL
jgi:hypothetical protein